jgi:glycosyltransferase involved in cell wall biosynthesis
MEPLRHRPTYSRKPGITLGIVSRLTPIKQFPTLFGIVTPILKRHPQFNLEIFGAGGYASVRDLRRVTHPLGEQVRFWGYQRDVASVYAQIDYLLTGLPEKEALGLNVIEAQACDTPVVAVAAAPFTETVIEGETGFFYLDPRTDQGADFERVLGILADLKNRPHPATALNHLQKFTLDAFVDRLRPIVQVLVRGGRGGAV